MVLDREAGVTVEPWWARRPRIILLLLLAFATALDTAAPAAQEELPVLDLGDLVAPRRELPGGLPPEKVGASGLCFYLIEEVHDVPAVQQQIAAILLRLRKEAGASVVCTESPAGTKFPALTFELGQRDILGDLGAALIEAGWLDGVSYAWLLQPFEVVGVDSKDSRELREASLRGRLRGSWEAAARASFDGRQGRLQSAFDRFNGSLAAAIPSLSKAGQERVRASLSETGSVERLAALRSLLAVLSREAGESSTGLAGALDAGDSLVAELDVRERAAARWNNAVGELALVLRRGDQEMAELAAEALRVRSHTAGIMVFGSRHTPGVVTALAGLGHSYRLITPRAADEFAADGGSGSSRWRRPDYLGFDQVWGRTVRPVPRLTEDEFVAEFQAFFFLEWVRRRWVSAPGRELPAPQAERLQASRFQLESCTSLPGRGGLLVPNGFVATITEGGRRLEGIVTPQRRSRRRPGLPLSGQCLGFIPTGSIKRLSELCGDDGVDSKVFDAYLDVVLSRGLTQGRAACLSLFTRVDGTTDGFTLSAKGEVQRLAKGDAKALEAFVTDSFESGIEDPRLSALVEKTVAPLYDGPAGQDRVLLLRSEYADERWHALSAIDSFSRGLVTVLATPMLAGDKPKTISELAQKLARAPGLRVDENGLVSNLVVLIDNPPGGEDAELEQLVVGLRERIAPEHVLFRPSKAKVLDAFEHAGELGDAVLVQFAHTVDRSDASGIELGSGEVIGIEDLASLKGIGIVHTSMGSCVYGALSEGAVGREAVVQSGGLVSVAPTFVPLESAKAYLRALLQALRSPNFTQIPSALLPQILRQFMSAGERESLPGPTILGSSVGRGRAIVVAA